MPIPTGEPTACATCPTMIENAGYSGVLCASCFKSAKAESWEPAAGSGARDAILPGIGLVPFFLSFTTSGATGINTLLRLDRIDYVAAICGPLAILGGCLQFRRAAKLPREARRRPLLIGGAGLLLGLFQLWRAL